MGGGAAPAAMVPICGGGVVAGGQVEHCQVPIVIGHRHTRRGTRVAAPRQARQLGCHAMAVQRRR